MIVFDESITLVPEHSGDITTEDDTTTEIGAEFFTSASMTSAAADTTTTPSTAATEEQFIQVTTAMQRQNVSVAQALQPQDSQSSAIPVVPDHPTPSVADGEPIQQSGDPDLFSQAAATLTPAVSFVNGKQQITLEPQSPGEVEAKGTQISTNVTSLGASDELNTVFDYSWTNLPVGSSTGSMEEPTEGRISTEIPDVDIYETDVISLVESTPPHILPKEEDLVPQIDATLFPASTMEGTAPSKTTQKTESGPAATIATEAMSEVTVTSADLVPSVLPAEPQITKATEESQTTKGNKESTTVITASVQEEVDESGVTPTYVKSDSTVTQTQKAEDKLPVTSSTEPHTATYKSEITEETHSTSASPAAADDIQSTLKSASTPSSDDADGSTPTSTNSDSESSTQDVEEGNETQTPKEFAFSTRAPLVSSSSAPNELTAKTEITPPRDVSSTESSTVAPTLAQTSEGAVISQGESTVSQIPSISPSERAVSDVMSTSEEVSSGVQQVNMFTTSPPSSSSAGTATLSSSLSSTHTTGQETRESKVPSQTVQTAGTEKTESVKSSAPTTVHEEKKQNETAPPSLESITTTASPLYSAIEIIKTTMASFTGISQYTTESASAMTDLPEGKVETTTSVTDKGASVHQTSATMATPTSPIKTSESGSTTISDITEDTTQTQSSTVTQVSSITETASLFPITAGESADDQTSNTTSTEATVVATMLSTDRAATGETQYETTHGSSTLGTVTPLLTTTEG
ncbi:flocculation protein FLO11-like, partial [Hippoglossus hippoglossus]|uniref:flocculation protein FLO11-like n=1 Tax=Hippoglossus hippoglossus TaxID=8267 RepID=UPI00148B7D1A